MRNTKLLVGAFALAAVGCGLTGCTPFAAAARTAPSATGTPTQGSAGSMTTSGSVAGVSTGPGRYLLQSMPAGTVWLDRGSNGRLRARVDVFGLTPGSTHLVSIDSRLGRPVSFTALTANSAGQADATLLSATGVGSLPSLSRFVIRLGDTTADPLAAEPIAESVVLPAHPVPGAAFALHAVTVNTSGVALGQPGGQAAISYDAAAQTLTVTLTAAGLTPGPHAAHIHLGSCLNQGPVKYMLADFVADANGAIINQTRVVTGVPSVPGPGNWYLNLHQGGMSQILANGAPTLYFRPMLCADLTSFATPNGTATPSPSSSPTATTSPTSPMTSPTMTTSPTSPTNPTSTPITPSPTGSPSATINAQPTHW
jgi:hypothetical protein